MRVLRTRTIAEDGDKHKNNANEIVKHKTIQMRPLRKRTMANMVPKHKQNGKCVTKHNNTGK